MKINVLEVGICGLRIYRVKNQIIDKWDKIKFVGEGRYRSIKMV